MRLLSAPVLTSPADIKSAVQRSRKLRAQRREYWWPGHNHYQAGINGGVIGQGYNVTNVTNTAPAVITTDKPHGMAAGNSATIRGVVGTTAVNTTGTVVNDGTLTATTFSMTAVNGNAAYIDGGTVLTPKTNGESADVFNIAGSGIVTSINLILGNNITQSDAQLWIYTDNDVAGSPSCKIPICQMLGLGNGVNWNTNSGAYDQANKLRGNGRWATQNLGVEWQAYDDWNLTTGPSCRVEFKYPIPFANGCRATIFQCGGSDNTSTNTWAITSYTPDVTSNLRLRCQTSPALLSDGTSPYVQSVVVGGADATIMTVAAGTAGYIVGTGTSFDSWNNDSTGPTVLERNIYVFRDQEAVASYQSSGTEDYFGSCFYFRNLVESQLDGAILFFWRPGGTGAGRFPADIALGAMFKDNLQADQGGIGYTNGVTMKYVYQPDGATRVLTNANMRWWTLYYQ